MHSLFDKHDIQQNEKITISENYTIYLINLMSWLLYMHSTRTGLKSNGPSAGIIYYPPLKYIQYHTAGFTENNWAPHLIRPTLLVLLVVYIRLEFAICNKLAKPFKWTILYAGLLLWIYGTYRCTLSDKVCQWLATEQWFSPRTPVSSTNKTDRHNITEILLKMALNTINQTNGPTGRGSDQPL
jgi:hypothetical protein